MPYILPKYPTHIFTSPTPPPKHCTSLSQNIYHNNIVYFIQFLKMLMVLVPLHYYQGGKKLEVATLYIATENKPQHHCCPTGPNSWCSFQRDLALKTRDHRPLKDPVPAAVLKVIKPVFDELADKNFLAGCESCSTQNAIESLHHRKDISIDGSPRRLTKRRNVIRNDLTLSPCVSSKCTARVDAHVNKPTNTLLAPSDCDETFSSSLRTYKGPAKSKPVNIKGGSTDTLSIGKSGADGGLSAFYK